LSERFRTGSIPFLSPCPCGHTIIFEKSEVFCNLKYRKSNTEKPFPLPSPCPQHVRTRQTLSPLTVEVFINGPLRYPKCGRFLLNYSHFVSFYSYLRKKNWPIIGLVQWRLNLTKKSRSFKTVHRSKTCGANTVMEL